MSSSVLYYSRTATEPCGRSPQARWGFLVLLLPVLVIAASPLWVPPSFGHAWLLGSTGFLLLVSGTVLVRQTRRRRALRYLELRPDALVAYDQDLRTTTLPWERIRCLDLTDGALHLIGEPEDEAQAPVIRIDYAFSAYTTLSHQFTGWAEAQGVPVYIDGKPWHCLNVQTLYRLSEVAVDTP